MKGVYVFNILSAFGLNKLVMDGTYSQDWFSNNIERWEKHFKKLRKLPIQALEIGSFEGRSAVWALENIFVHPDATITCVDDFSLKEFAGKKYYPGVIKRHFLENTKPYGKRVKLVESSSREALKDRALLEKKFDFIYIDANRHAKHVMEDAVLAFPLLNVGGHIVFDDYTISKTHDYTCPKKGIDAFLDLYNDEIKVIETKWQVIARKVKPKRSPKECRSELFSR